MVLKQLLFQQEAPSSGRPGCPERWVPTSPISQASCPLPLKVVFVVVVAHAIALAHPPRIAAMVGRPPSAAFHTHTMVAARLPLQHTRSPCLRVMTLPLGCRASEVAALCC